VWSLTAVEKVEHAILGAKVSRQFYECESIARPGHIDVDDLANAQAPSIAPRDDARGIAHSWVRLVIRDHVVEILQYGFDTSR
jgi:hypothetical protein